MEDQRKWYQKKRYIIPAAVIGAYLLFGGESATTTIPANIVQTPSDSTVPETKTNLRLPSVESGGAGVVKPVTQKTVTHTSVSDSSLSNDSYYTNVDGKKVHSPAYAPSIPSGASAQCRDGTYSFSQNRRGTCSHHGGVATWY